MYAKTFNECLAMQTQEGYNKGSAKTFNECFYKDQTAKTFAEIYKYNHYHDEKGRFASRNRAANSGIIGDKRHTLSDTAYQKAADVMNQEHIKGKLSKEWESINLTDYSFDDKHINSERKHNVTKAEAQEFIDTAKGVITRWNGDNQIYISSKGTCYVKQSEKIIATAYKRAEYDPKTSKIIEVLENERIYK